jgi:signal transduction histidine kinase
MRLTIKHGIIVHSKISWLLFFSIFSLGFVSWLIYANKRNSDSANLRINQTYEITEMIQRISTSISESASAEYPGTYDDPIKRELDSLTQLTRDNQDQQQQIGLLRRYILAKIALGNGQLNPPAAGPVAATRNNIATIKTLLFSMLAEEKNLLGIRKQLYEKANERTALGLVLGRIAGFLFVVIILIQLNRDISRRKLVQEHLVKAIAEAQTAKQMQEQFLANMSHEIRTPMNGIKGMTDLLMGTPLSEKQQELTGLIKSSANALLVIINDILDFSKIQAGKLNIEKIDFNVTKVLQNTAAIFDHRLKKKGVLLQVDVAPDIPHRLIGDPHRLNQVLTNLLGNAIKFTEHGHIHMQAALLRKSAGEVVLSFTIKDTGIGIAADSIPSIFDSFSQAGLDISRRYGGTGLGLTICKQLLHLQGGDITVTSKEREGSVFNFYLPFEYGEGAFRPQPAPNATHDHQDMLAGKRFLVAEDNEINQKLIDYVLRKAGGSVELAKNGAEAIRYLQNGDIFDLIIMDLQMPEMDGYAATKYIRGDLHLQTPIIAMTATAMKGEHLQCLESGMNEYMTKPFEFEELYKRINNLLS